MPAGKSKTSTHKSPTTDAVVITAGCILPDGIIDLVASEDPCRPNLVFWDGHRAKIVPRIRHGDLWYQAPELHPSVCRITVGKQVPIGARFGANDRTLPWLQAADSVSCK